MLLEVPIIFIVLLTIKHILALIIIPLIQPIIAVIDFFVIPSNSINVSIIEYKHIIMVHRYILAPDKTAGI